MNPVVHRDQELQREIRAFNEELERTLAALPSVHTLPPEQVRQARRDGRGVFGAPQYLPQARTVQIEGPAGPLPLRVIPPSLPPDGAFLHLHGGGWTLGDCDLQDVRLGALAEATGLLVVSVGYRLGPEHPFPAGPDDCEAAARWLLEGGGQELARGADAAGGEPARFRYAIGGDSAGGHLTATTLLRLRDRRGLTGAFEAAVLQYGAFDLSMSPSQRLWGERNLVLSAPIIKWFGDNFLPTVELERRRNPELSPLFARLDGMPPALFTVGTQDPLLDDTLFMFSRWTQAGAAAELHIWPEAPHGFLDLPMTVGPAHQACEHEFLRRTLGLPRR